ncbi:dTDP-4-dehydrorhamnose reductase [Acidisphaera rubrifaciens]|nr:dTDP-4-dehydrorhamnose reductase [Acidisphaera rubrifaciens]
MTMLVLGGSGQLALALSAAAEAAGIDCARLGRPEFDFDRPETVAALDSVPARLIVNAAAYTAVDAAEGDAAAAERANAAGPALLAAHCVRRGIPLVHISTDYVFDGSKGAPYIETDPTAPLGVYGATKLAGERAAMAAWPRTVILRTAWVYSATGRNFARTMLGAARKTDTLRVVADQRGCPTTAADLAAAIVAIAPRLSDGWEDGLAGIYHAAGGGETTWHGLAVALFEEAARHGLKMPTVTPIATSDWPTPVRRPADSRLDCGKLARVFGVALPHWRDSVAPVVDAWYAAA